ncbi:hypothetical protein SAY86_029336 [Trapa natans]|uniref:Uncharacterized protein n=1 Tax=Trapa natans TaxID=22666 RepID=A0AAN7M147_TRANT|nr:hypothetical protein SAY86_029336 [Trapa natans]
MATSLGLASPSCTGSPGQAMSSAATRRRVADPSDPADQLSDDEDNFTIAVHHHNHVHHYHHYQSVNCPTLRRRLLMGVPGSILRKVENLLFWSYGAADRMRPPRKFAHKILCLLTSLMIISFIMIMSYLSYLHADRQSVERGVLRLNLFKDDKTEAQMAASENEEAFIPKSEVEKLPTPEIWMKPNSENYHQCIERPKNRISTSTL